MQFNNLDKEFNELKRDLGKIEREKIGEDCKKNKKLFFLEGAFRKLKERKGIVVIDLPDRIGGEDWNIIICKDGRSLEQWIYSAHLGKEYKLHKNSESTAQVIRKAIEYFSMKKNKIIKNPSKRYQKIDQIIIRDCEEEITKYNEVLEKLEKP